MATPATSPTPISFRAPSTVSPSPPPRFCRTGLPYSPAPARSSSTPPCRESPPPPSPPQIPLTSSPPPPAALAQSIHPHPLNTPTAFSPARSSASANPNSSRSAQPSDCPRTTSASPTSSRASKPTWTQTRHSWHPTPRSKGSSTGRGRECHPVY